jgi:hypothetical protein
MEQRLVTLVSSVAMFLAGTFGDLPQGLGESGRIAIAAIRNGTASVTRIRIALRFFMTTSEEVVLHTAQSLRPQLQIGTGL